MTDVAAHLDELREQGWGEEELAIELAEIRRQWEPGRIWPENWTTASVFLECQWTIVAGFGGAFYQGIATSEIESACRMLAVAKDERKQVLTDVRLMAKAAAAVLNEKKD